MNQKQEISVRLNASGEVDTAFYIAQAKQQRGEVFAQFLLTLRKAVKKMLSPNRFARQSVPAYSN